MITLNRFLTKTCPGNILSHHVHIIKTIKRPTEYLTAPLKRNEQNNINVLVVFSNGLVAKHVKEALGDSYEMDDIPLFIPRSIADVMRIPLVTVLDTHCDIETKEQVWKLHYYQPQNPSTSVFRQHMYNPTTFDENEN